MGLNDECILQAVMEAVADLMSAAEVKEAVRTSLARTMIDGVQRVSVVLVDEEDVIAEQTISLYEE